MPAAVISGRYRGSSGCRGGNGPVPVLQVAAILLGASLAAGAPAETRRVVAGPQYDKGSVWRFWFGDGYRKVWKTPVELPVLDLRTEAGGLTPEFQVGGKETTGLALKGADGRSYSFRKLHKTPLAYSRYRNLRDRTDNRLRRQEPRGRSTFRAADTR